MWFFSIGTLEFIENVDTREFVEWVILNNCYIARMQE